MLSETHSLKTSIEENGLANPVASAPTLRIDSKRPTPRCVFQLLKTKDKENLERSRKRGNSFCTESSIIISSRLPTRNPGIQRKWDAVVQVLKQAANQLAVNQKLYIREGCPQNEREKLTTKLRKKMRMNLTIGGTILQEMINQMFGWA